jgi:hypothetical protein
MDLKYVGPKVEITKNGVSFDINKEDKYVYLNIALQLIKALEHDYIPEKTYTYNADTARLNDSEINSEVRKTCKDLEKQLVDAKERAEHFIENEIDRVKRNTLLSDEERTAYLKNIDLMRDYIIQRNMNKAAYYCVVERLAEQLKSEHIDYVIVPMFQKFAHVLHSAQGVLLNQKFPIDSNTEIFTKERTLYFKLDVINR